MDADVDFDGIVSARVRLSGWLPADDRRRRGRGPAPDRDGEVVDKDRRVRAQPDPYRPTGAGSHDAGPAGVRNPMLTPGVAMQHPGNTTARAAKPPPVMVVAMSTPLMPLAEAAETVDYAATAFMLVGASLVLLMTPGLALFYGGMTRAKSVLNMIMMSFGALGVVGVIYVLWGYSMSFGNRGRRAASSPTPSTCSASTASSTTIVNPFGFEGYGYIPETRVRRLPAHLRGHHGRADQRRRRRPRQVLHLAGLLRHLGDPRLLPDRPHGVGRRRAVRRRGRPVGQDLRRDRRRRQRRCRSTSPVARSSTSTPVSPAWCSP